MWECLNIRLIRDTPKILERFASLTKLSKVWKAYPSSRGMGFPTNINHLESISRELHAFNVGKTVYVFHSFPSTNGCPHNGFFQETKNNASAFPWSRRTAPKNWPKNQPKNMLLGFAASRAVGGIHFQLFGMFIFIDLRANSTTTKKLAHLLLCMEVILRRSFRKSKGKKHGYSCGLLQNITVSYRFIQLRCQSRWGVKEWAWQLQSCKRSYFLGKTRFPHQAGYYWTSLKRLGSPKFPITDANHHYVATEISWCCSCPGVFKSFLQRWIQHGTYFM